MKTIDCQQGCVEWHEARSRCATASELDFLVSPTYKVRLGEMPHTYLCRKLAERWIGRPIISYTGGAVQQGSILEDEARPWYELLTGKSVQTVGFCTTDDGTLGCSPDGLLCSYGLEIKCPLEHTHMKWLLANECPPDHLLQVQGCMFVTGLDEWEFVSYARDMPPLIVRVKRDQQAQDAIAAAVERFSILLNAHWDELVSKYGEPAACS